MTAVQNRRKEMKTHLLIFAAISLSGATAEAKSKYECSLDTSTIMRVDGARRMYTKHRDPMLVAAADIQKALLADNCFNVLMSSPRAKQEYPDKSSAAQRMAIQFFWPNNMRASSEFLLNDILKKLKALAKPKLPAARVDGRSGSTGGQSSQGVR
jgi:hypothetical protein